MKKQELITKLEAFPYGLDGFWLVGGAALVLFGVREETGDIDMGCTPQAADRLEADGCLCGVSDDGTRRFRIGPEIEVFENWLYDAVETVGGFPVQSLRGLREMKLRLGREKDLRDIRLIDAFLSREANAD